MSVLLDTHAALWLVQGDPRLGTAARERISSVAAEDVYVSDLMLFEIALLVFKKRVEIVGDLSVFLRDFSNRFRTLPIDSEIAALAVGVSLPQSDPFDRIFVATAVRHTLPLVTRDKMIRESGLVETIW